MTTHSWSIYLEWGESSRQASGRRGHLSGEEEKDWQDKGVLFHAQETVHAKALSRGGRYPIQGEWHWSRMAGSWGTRKNGRKQSWGGEQDHIAKGFACWTKEFKLI